jgi:hypothetical protein
MNNFFTFNIQDIAIILLYIIGALFLCQKFSSNKDYRLKMIPYFMALLHLVCTVSYYFLLLNTEGDARGYYLGASQLTSLENTIPMSNNFIKAILFPFVHYLQFSFFSCSILFSFFSLRGFIFLYALILKLVDYRYTRWLWLFIMPSMHFWTAAVGKDALIFLGLSWIIYNYFTNKSKISFIVPLLIVTLTRFYVVALLGAGTAIALVLISKQLKLSYKIFAMIIFAGVGFLIFPYFLNAISVGDVSNISKRSEAVIRANQEGGGAVDLQGSNLLVKWFSYLFRPFLFEARSPQMFITALENVMWLVIFYKIYLGIRRVKFVPEKRRTFFWIALASLITATLPSSFILSNFGISSRQKIMIVPLMMYLFFESMLAIHQKKISLRRKSLES